MCKMLWTFKIVYGKYSFYAHKSSNLVPTTTKTTRDLIVHLIPYLQKDIFTHYVPYKYKKCTTAPLIRAKISKRTDVISAQKTTIRM